MRLTVVGSSDAFNSAGRGHACYLAEGRGFGPLMIDFGATALLGLRQLGRAPTELAAIAITHLHADHVGGLPFLVIDGMFHDVRREPLEVLGPPGTAQRLEASFVAAYPDVVGMERPFELRVREIQPDDQTELAGVTLQAFASGHMVPPDVSLCLRASFPDGTCVAFSGDSTLGDGLLRAAAGADLLVAECSGLAQPCGRHCTWEEWLEAFATLPAKRLLLTHLSTAVRERAAELQRQVPPGVDVAFADDGLVLEI